MKYKIEKDERDSLRTFVDSCDDLRHIRALRCGLLKTINLSYWHDLRERRICFLGKDYQDRDSDEWIRVFNIEMRKYSLDRDHQNIKKIKNNIKSILNRSRHLKNNERDLVVDYMNYLISYWDDCERDSGLSGVMSIIDDNGDFAWVDFSDKMSQDRLLNGMWAHKDIAHHAKLTSLKNHYPEMFLLDKTKAINVSFLRLGVIFKFESIIRSIFNDVVLCVDDLRLMELNWSAGIEIPSNILTSYGFNLRENVECMCRHGFPLYGDISRALSVSFDVPMIDDMQVVINNDMFVRHAVDRIATILRCEKIQKHLLKLRSKNTTKLSNGDMSCSLCLGDGGKTWISP